MDAHGFAAFLSLALAGPALAQVEDPGARAERLADGVYAIVHERATDYWSHGNTGVVVGDDGVLVIDATYLPSRARADIALIRKITDKPVRYLAYTHWHDDHTNGASAYREAFPGLAIVAEKEMARFIEVTGPAHASEAKAEGSEERKRLAELEAQLASGRDAAGGALSDSAKRSLSTVIAQRKNELAELEAFVTVPPNLRYERSLTLDLGRRKVELANQGRGNSPDDVTFYLPAEKVLFVGDLLVQDPVPYYSNSWPVPWVGILRNLESVPFTSLVPGHGPVYHDRQYLSLVRELMETVISRVDALTRQGKSVEDMQASIQVDEFRARWPAWNTSDHGLWTRGIRRLVERAWRGVRGQGG